MGVWAEAQLDLSNRYIRAIYELVRQGKLYWSTGANPNLVEVAPDGHIKNWPLIEGSLTPTPAEPRYTNIKQIKSAIKSVQFSELEQLIDDAEIDWAAMGEELPDAPLGVKAASNDESDTPDDAGDPDPAKTPEEQPPADASPDPPSEDDKATDAKAEGQGQEASADEPAKGAEPGEGATPPSDTGSEPPADPPATDDPPSSSDPPADDSGTSPDPSTKANIGDFSMDDHVTTIVSSVANGLSATLSEDGVKSVADWMLDELGKPVGGRDKVTVDHLKIGLSQDSFRQALVAKIAEAAKAGESADDPRAQDADR